MRSKVKQGQGCQIIENTFMCAFLRFLYIIKQQKATNSDKSKTIIIHSFTNKWKICIPNIPDWQIEEDLTKHPTVCLGYQGCLECKGCQYWRISLFHTVSWIYWQMEDLLTKHPTVCLVNKSSICQYDMLLFDSIFSKEVCQYNDSIRVARR